MLRLEDIPLRDPFVLPLAEEGVYYLFGTTDADCWGAKATGFDAYRSENLEHWEGPIPAFRPPADFWADRQFWAPECHRYQDRYYILASFKAEGIARGTAILVADHPAGPFRPHSTGAVTPRDWECLDGTLYVDPDGGPWMVFCHEWVQVRDGTICAMPLRLDLNRAAGTPRVLFAASEAPWAASPPEQPGVRVTDGPFLHRTALGSLLMLWSTIGAHGYAMGYAISASGGIDGPWRQVPEPLFSRDGGHGMLFYRFDGQLMVTLHHPNTRGLERACLFALEEFSDGLRLQHPTAITRS